MLSTISGVFDYTQHGNFPAAHLLWNQEQLKEPADTPRTAAAIILASAILSATVTWGGIRWFFHDSSSEQDAVAQMKSGELLTMSSCQLLLSCYSGWLSLVPCWPTSSRPQTLSFPFASLMLCLLPWCAAWRDLHSCNSPPAENDSTDSASTAEGKDEWEPHVPRATLRRAIAYEGDLLRFDRLIHKVRAWGNPSHRRMSSTYE